MGTMFFAALSVLQAEPLTSAKVNEVKNIAQLKKDAGEERPAVAGDQVSGKDVLSTGAKSRVELEFADKSIARLGSHTVFSFDPQSRNMQIERGTALIHVPPGQDGSTQIRTPAVTAAILGDVVEMGVASDGSTQVIALSQDEKGPVKVTLNKTGETRDLKAGEMLVINPMALKIPQPVPVSVEAIGRTSGLIGGFEKPLPKSAVTEVRATQQFQNQEITNGKFEGPRKMDAKPDLRNLSFLGPREFAIQTAANRSFAGFYVGDLRLPNMITPVSFQIGPDGRLMGIANTPGGPRNLIGIVDPGGHFRATDDFGGNAEGVIQNGVMTGIRHPPPDVPNIEVLKAVKQ